MDRFTEMRIFMQVVESRSFRSAAVALAMPPSTVSDVVKRAEARLGTRLLDRTTRVVAPTADGLAWFDRCRVIVAQVEDAEASFTGVPPQGRVRLDAVGSLTRKVLLPALPDFLNAHPKLDLVLSEGERLVDLIREGVDIALRTGPLDDSDLFSRRLGQLEEATVASPEYLNGKALPKSPDDLDGHKMIGFFSTRTQDVLPLDFTWDGLVVTRKLPQSLTVTGTETLISATRAGIGITQLPRYRISADLRDGKLVEILPDFKPTPSPLSAVYPRDRQLSPRVRVVLD